MPVTDPYARRFAQTLKALGYEAEILQLPAGTATARDAAAAVGSDLGSIAKTIVFRAGDEPILVIAAGHNRVDTKKLASLTGTKVRIASPESTAIATGYPVGGVPPFGHPKPLRTFIDEDLLTCELIYAGAGSPCALFALRPDELLKLTGGTPADIKL